MLKATIYTDGSYYPSIGLGGYAGYIQMQLPNKGDKKNPASVSGVVENTTSERMELTAVLKALEVLPGPRRIQLFTDSTSIVNGIMKMRFLWERKRWKRGKKDVTNRDIWEPIHDILSNHIIYATWVKSHSGNSIHDMVDRLAKSEIEWFLKRNPDFVKRNLTK